MGVDRGLVRAFGYFSVGVVALGAGGAMAVGFVTGKTDVIRLFTPLLIAYGAIVISLWLGLELYFRVQSRFFH